MNLKDIEEKNKALFEGAWCPLFGNTPIIDNIYDPSNSQILRCFTVITDVREYFWNIYNKTPIAEPVIKFNDPYKDIYSAQNPDPETTQNYPSWKIKVARVISRSIPIEVTPDLVEPLNNRFWKAIAETKENCIPGIDHLPVSDTQILGIVAIKLAWAGLKVVLYYEDPQDVPIKAIDLAESIYSAASLMAEDTKQKNLKEHIDKITKAKLAYTHDMLLKSLEKQETPQPQPQGNVFNCIGDSWEIKFENDSLTVKDRKYMPHLKYILEHPFRKMTLLELDKEVNANLYKTSITKEVQSDCMNTLTSSDNSGKINKDDNKDGWKHLVEKRVKLKKEIEDAKELGKDEKEAKLQIELDELINAMAKGMYKAGITRTGTQEGSILKAINRCIKNVKKAAGGSPTGKQAADHIDKDICRGVGHIIYSPSNEPNWNQ